MKYGVWEGKKGGGDQLAVPFKRIKEVDDTRRPINCTGEFLIKISLSPRVALSAFAGQNIPTIGIFFSLSPTFKWVAVLRSPRKQLRDLSGHTSSLVPLSYPCPILSSPNTLENGLLPQKFFYISSFACVLFFLNKPINLIV